MVRAYALGEGGLSDAESQAMDVTGELISQLETPRDGGGARQRSIATSQPTFTERVAIWSIAAITGVQPFVSSRRCWGLRDGLVPVSTLGSDYFR